MRYWIKLAPTIPWLEVTPAEYENVQRYISGWDVNQGCRDFSGALIKGCMSDEYLPDPRIERHMEPTYRYRRK